MAPADCASNACFELGLLGGVCSECDGDADCAWGCHPGNPLTSDCALCCDGSAGCGCESGLACQPGLYCTSLLSVPGIITQSTCSECAIDVDCPGGELCSPNYDLNSFAGQHDCVAPGSQAIGDGCEASGSGDLQCASGNCAPVAFMGIPVLDICSECNADTDCFGASICIPPEIALVGVALTITPGFCS